MLLQNISLFNGKKSPLILSGELNRTKKKPCFLAEVFSCVLGLDFEDICSVLVRWSLFA